MPIKSPKSIIEEKEYKKEKNNENELQNTKIDYKKTISKLPSHIFRFKKDNDGNILSVLSEGEIAKNFDITTEKIKGKNLKNIFSNQKEYNKVLPYYEKAFSGEYTNFEIKLKDTWFKTMIQPFKVDRDGNICEIIGFSENISKRKKAEKKLIENEQRYHAIFEGVNDAVFLHDAKTGTILNVNKKACEMYGYSKEEFKNLKISDLTSKNETINDRIYKNTINNLNQRNIKPVQWHAKKKNGKRFWVEINPSLVDIGEKKRLIVSVRNINEQKKAEKKLKNYREELENKVKNRTEELEKAILESENTKNNLKNIIDSANEIIISFDKNNRIQTWGKKVENLTGYKFKQVKNKKIDKLKFFENTNELTENISRLYLGKPISTNLIVLKTKDNSKRIIKASYSKIKKGNKTDGILLIGEDITHNIESHERFLTGYSYYFLDEKKDFVFQIFKNIVELNTKKGLYITRTKKDSIKYNYESKFINVYNLKEDNSINYNNIIRIEKIFDRIKSFITKNKGSAILIDRTDFLITNFSFERFLKLIYKISDIVSDSNCILIINIKSSFLDEKELSILKNELTPIPNQEIEKIQIMDDYYKILLTINKYNINNILVPYKKISDELKINRKTLSKKIKDLEKQGLLIVDKNGRSKTPYVTDKGKIILEKKKN